MNQSELMKMYQFILVEEYRLEVICKSANNYIDKINMIKTSQQIPIKNKIDLSKCRKKTPIRKLKSLNKDEKIFIEFINQIQQIDK